MSVLRLLGVVLLLLILANVVHTANFSISSQENFNLGTYNNTEFNTSYIALEYYNDTQREFPENRTNDGLLNMSGNVLVLHLNNHSRFGENGTLFYDFSGVGNNATCVNTACPSTATSGQLDGGVSFDGGDYLSILNSQSLNITGDTLTISLWINTSTTQPADYDRLVAKAVALDADPYVRYSIWRKADGVRRLSFGISTGGAGSLKYVDSQGEITLSNWTHVIGRYNGSHVALFINGEFDNSVAAAGNIAASNEPLVIGADTAGNNDFFDGQLDEVAIWNRSLSDSEIRLIYQRQRGPYGKGTVGNYSSQVFDAGVLSSWRNVSWTQGHCYGCALPDSQGIESGFVNNLNMSGNILLLHLDEGSGTLQDSSGFGNNATAVGATLNQSGRFNKSVLLDGVDDYLEVADSQSLNITGNQVTVAIWVKTPEGQISTALDAYQRIVVKEVAGNANPYARVALFRIADSRQRFSFWVSSGGAGTFQEVLSTRPIPVNRWTHLAGVYNGTHLMVYLDGKMDNQVAGDNTNIGSTNESWVIGTNTASYSLNHFFNGSVDEVAIWNRSLSPEEVYGLYLRGAAELNLTVRACDDALCSGEGFSTVPGTVLQNVSFQPSRYFQVSYEFYCEDSTVTPLLYNASINYSQGVLPGVSIQLPVNTSNYSTNSVDLDYTVNGSSDTCWYAVDGGSNTTLANCDNTTITPGFGRHNILVYANDSFNNVNASENTTFTVDTYAPTLSVQSPVNDSNHSGSVSLSFTFSENLTSTTCAYSLDGAANVSIASCANTSISPAEGRHTILLFVNDTVGNLNTSQLNFTVDTTPPFLSVGSPTNGSYVGSSVSFSYTVQDTIGGLRCAYSLNNSANVSLANCDNTSVNLAEANYSVFFYANDSSGNLNVSSNISFRVDLTNPTLTLESPANGTQFNDSSVVLSLTVRDAISLPSCWYVLDGGSNTSLASCDNATITVASAGSHTLLVYANDSVGNVNVSNTTFTVSLPATSSTVRHSSSDEEEEEPFLMRIDPDPVCVGNQTTVSIVQQGVAQEGLVRIFFTGPANLLFFQVQEGQTMAGEVSFTPHSVGFYEAVARIKDGPLLSQSFQATRCVEEVSQEVEEPQEAAEPESQAEEPQPPEIPQVTEESKEEESQAQVKELLREAEGAIQEAIREGRTSEIAAAQARYQEARAAFVLGNFHTAGIKAMEALEYAEKSQVPLTTVATKDDWSVAVGFAVLGILALAAFYFYTKK